MRDIILEGFALQASAQARANIAIENKKCPFCGIDLFEKGDWIFCPKNSKEIPQCDSNYHFAHNKKTGQGFITA